MQNKLVKYVIFISLCSLFFQSLSTAEENRDDSIYSALLKKHVKNGRVNYDGFKKDEGLLDAYLAVLSNTESRSLVGSRRFAFYINAYNAFTIKLVLTKFPGINSIKEAGSFFSSPWSKKFISLQNRKVSLDYIEHEILRSEFKDPRVHFAINCASKSCPHLLNEPYQSKKLEIQLDSQAADFLSNRKNIFIKGDTIFISKIFKWFKEDFSNNPLLFVKQYVPEELKKQIISMGESIKISYIDYDWSLNR